MIITRYKVVESHGLPRNKEKQNGGKTSPPRWCVTKMILWSERKKAEMAEKPSPQNGAFADNCSLRGKDGWQSQFRSTFPWKKTRKVGAYEAVLVADGVCWHCLGALAPWCQLPCFLLVTLCVCVWSVQLLAAFSCHLLHSASAGVAVTGCCSKREKGGEAEPSSTKEWRPNCYSQMCLKRRLQELRKRQKRLLPCTIPASPQEWKRKAIELLSECFWP